MAPETAPRRATTALLATFFFLSGFSGLVYQVVWFRMLSRAFGVTVYAITTVLVVFMTGLALGSFAAERLARGRSLLRLYGALELLVGAAGAASSTLMPLLPGLLGKVVEPIGPHQGAVVIVRGLLSCVVLLPPTLLMGATLPILSGYVVERSEAVGHRAGLLYGINTLGAVVGVLAAGFVFIATLGEGRTILVAVSTNLLIGALSLAYARVLPEATLQVASSVNDDPAELALTRRILLVSLLSGICALSFEVIWFRVLTVLLGNSVYAFSSMLGAYLVGIGVGSVLMSSRVAKIVRPIRAFAFLETAVAVLALASLEVFVLLGRGTADTHNGYAVIWKASDFSQLAVNALLVVLPATLLYGAIFPLATRLVTRTGEVPEAAVGRLYGYNTIGSILGSLLTGALLIPRFGTRDAFLVIVVVSLGLGLYLLDLSRRREGVARASMVAGVAVAVAALVAGAAIGDPFLQVLTARVPAKHVLLANAEDQGATISVFESPRHVRTLYVNGLYVSNTANGIGEQMINFPLSFAEGAEPKRVLAVGLGVGEALRYAVDVGHDITVAELHPAVVELFRKLNPDAESYLGSPHAHVVLADGRNYLLNTQEKYDLILVDGSPPVYASGMVNLYSREFVQLAKEHLTPTGTFVVWFPVICFADDFWRTERNFVDAFDNVQVLTAPGTSNAMMMGADGPKGKFAPSTELVTERLARWRRRADVTGTTMASWIIAPEADLREVAALYPPVTDDRPDTEFPLFRFIRGEPYYSDNRFLFAQRFPKGSHKCSGAELADCAAQCDLGQGDSCFLEAALYLDGRRVPRDDARAAEVLRAGCKAGSSESCSNLGFLAQEGRGLAKNEELAVSLFRESCDNGALLACRHLAIAYHLGRGVGQDDSVAVPLLRHACRENVWTACEDLAGFYESGSGVPRDVTEAARLHELACGHGDSAACAHGKPDPPNPP